MNTTTITEINMIEEGSERHDFEVKDNQGRAVGTRIHLWVRIVAEGERVWHVGAAAYLPAGTFYAWQGYATRAGKNFGARQDAHYCTTEAERVAAVEKYLAAAKKRATKQFA